MSGLPLSSYSGKVNRQGTAPDEQKTLQSLRSKGVLHRGLEAGTKAKGRTRTALRKEAHELLKTQLVNTEMLVVSESPIDQKGFRFLHETKTTLEELLQLLETPNQVDARFLATNKEDNIGPGVHTTLGEEVDAIKEDIKTCLSALATLMETRPHGADGPEYSTNGRMAHIMGIAPGPSTAVYAADMDTDELEVGSVFNNAGVHHAGDDLGEVDGGRAPYEYDAFLNEDEAAATVDGAHGPTIQQKVAQRVFGEGADKLFPRQDVYANPAEGDFAGFEDDGLADPAEGDFGGFREVDEGLYGTMNHSYSAAEEQLLELEGGGDIYVNTDTKHAVQYTDTISEKEMIMFRNSEGDITTKEIFGTVENLKVRNSAGKIKNLASFLNFHSLKITP
ncbi:hypothetical protein DID78_03445 [Candidatus Marinamargulisbacteria bacterium SCGC AG-343-D04]|nr:hypothetical protein DID78_03445 [Candidatus Marinamargulisbacteria bacterium SCGC AG-343-D04]